MSNKSTAHSAAEHGLHTLEKLVGEGDFEVAGIMYDMTAANIAAYCDERQEARLRSLGEVLEKLDPEPGPETPSFGC